MKINTCVFLLILITPLSIFGQDELFNYASNASTEITAEYLDEKNIYKLVNGDLSKARFKKISKTPYSENDWYYFNFYDTVEIDNIQLLFSSERCLDYELRFEIILSDTLLEILIGQIDSIYKIGEKSESLLLKRKNIYPRGNGFINTIKINSRQKPKSITINSPEIDISEKKRTQIIHRLKGLSNAESRVEKKLWKARRKYFNKIFKKKLDKHEKRVFEIALYGQDENLYCYGVRGNIKYLNNKNLKAINDECDCDLHEQFFTRGLPPTEEMMERPFTFLGHRISYAEDTTELILKKYLEGGDAWAGHAIPHICLLNKRRYLDKIDSLKCDQNVFTQVQVIRGLLHFKERRKALEISKKIYQKEVQSIVNDSISIYGGYSWIGLNLMNEYYPNEMLPLLLDLYKKYRSLYPEEMKISDHWSMASSYGVSIGKRIESFQGCDERILRYIEAYLRRFPHLSNNSSLIEFKKYIDKKTSDNGIYIDCY